MLPRRWKVFRIACMIQLILSAFMAGRALVYFFTTGRGFHAMDTICFTLVVMFASLGLTMIHHYYPDTLLETRRKRYFNFLFLFNVLMIVIIGGHVYDERWAFYYLYAFNISSPVLVIRLLADAILYLLILLLHIRILFGMFWLRRELYANYLHMVDQLATGQDKV